jgi:tetratricopeptide (TPR) repeat protein
MTDSHLELDLARRYATRRLDAAAAGAFEDHLVVCDRCQTEMRLSLALHEVVRTRAAADPTIRTRWIVGIAAALAASVAAILLWPAPVDPTLAALGQVHEPPMYIGMSVRSMPRRSDSLFNTAMALYVRHEYDPAATALRASLEAGSDTVPTEFFLGSAELMAGRPAAAVTAYAQVIGAGPAATVYLAESHMYRARALLQLGRRADALVELAAVMPADGDNALRARSLADSVRAVTSR